MLQQFFLSQVIFVFLLFLVMVICMLTKLKQRLQYRQNKTKNKNYDNIIIDILKVSSDVMHDKVQRICVGGYTMYMLNSFWLLYN